MFDEDERIGVAMLRSRLVLAAAGLTIAAVLTATPAAAFAVGGPAPGAVSAQTVKLPSGPGSVRGLADDAAVSAFTGQVEYAVPIELPRGPGGLVPSLSLGYAGELGNGPLGVGWILSQPGVRRSLRLGVPAYDATDELELVGMGAGGQLVRLASGEYRMEGHGHGFVGREVDGGFELVDPDGLTYRFGTTPAGRKASGGAVAFWYLEQVRDLTGQTIDHRYRQDLGEVYLDAIEWGPAVGPDRAFRAELVYEGRPDAVVSYRTGFRVESAQRLAEIRVWSFGGVQRVVELSYDDGFPLTRLAGVKVRSADGQDALPELSLTYAAAQTGGVRQVPGMDGWALNLNGTSLFDVDDDGAMDLLRLTVNGHSYRRNVGDAFDAPVTVAGAAGASLDSVRLLDLTGDSGAEMVWQQGSQWKVFRLSGAGPASKSWMALGDWPGAQNINLASVAICDLDGDYRMDVVAVSGSQIRVRMGTAAGLGAPVTRPGIDPARPFIQPGSSSTFFPDINGDGLADVAYTAASQLYLYLGKGDGTVEKYRDLAYPWTGTVDPTQIRLGDLNRDGLLDLSVVRAGNVSWYRGKAGGTVDTAPVQIPRPPGTDAAVVVALADANGNGSDDIVWSSTAGLWVLDLAGPTSAGMLGSIENGLGQTQRFEYEASAQLAFAAADAGTPWTAGMPVSIPVAVKNRLELASGEPTRSTRLDVRDGIYDRAERRFIGFGEALLTRRDPADGAPAVETVRRIQRFHPGLGLDRVLRGQIFYERIEDGTGRVFRETEHEVAAVTVQGLPAGDPRLRRAVVTATEVLHHDGHSPPLATRAEHAHDGEGRVTEDRELGRLDLSGDESIARRRYTDGRSTQGVRDEICEEWVIGLDDAGGEVVLSHSQKLFGDDQSVAPLCNAGRGWERVTRQYLADESRWVSIEETAYDARGNPVEVEKGGVTRHIEYDGNGLHPVAEEVQPSADRTLRWEATWDAVLGQPLTVRDATGVVLEAGYDGLGRLRSLGRSGQAPHLHYRYHWNGPRPHQETFSFDGDADAVPALPATWTATSRWRHSVEVFDSAGEPRFSATRRLPNRWLVSGHRTRDTHGRAIAVAETFEWQGSFANLPGAALPASAALRTVSYDALDRLVERTLPTGTRNTYEYSAFATTITTDGLAPVTTALDGQDRIVRTSRVIDGVTEAVDASYDAAGRVTSMRLPAATGIVEHRFEYDSLGRLVFASDPDIGDRQLQYDDGGRLVAHTNGAGQTIEYTYDGAGRLEAVQADDGSSFLHHYDVAIDAGFANTAGRLAWVEEPTGQVELGYDSFGRASRVRRTVDGKTADHSTTYSASGLVRAVDHGSDLHIDHVHDAAGRTIGIGDLWQLEEQDAAGRILRERFGNGVVQKHDRDDLGQATRIEILRPSGSPMHDVAVTYAPFGAVSTVVDSDGSGLDHSATFTYDTAARLTGAAIGGGASQLQFAYAYDGLQNMVRREAHGPIALGMLTGEYRYGETEDGGARGPRQLTSVVPDPEAGSPARAETSLFDYDLAGRMTNQGDLALDYNGFDQLVRVQGLSGPGSPGTVEHAYGYDGQRVSTREPGGLVQTWFTSAIMERADGARDHHVRLGDRLIARITMEPAAAGSGAGPPASPTAVVSGRGAAIVQALLAVAGLLFVLAVMATPRSRRARRHAAVSAATAVALLLSGCGVTTSSSRHALSTTRQVLYYHQAIGAGPSFITRADGTVFEERRFEPFGEEIDAYRELPGGGSEIGPVDYRRDDQNHLNKQTDPATGWSYHGARWMAPETARWLTPDPPVKGPDSRFLTDPWGLHPYQYVEQNPVLFWDPDGRERGLLPSSAANDICVARGTCSYEEWEHYHDLVSGRTPKPVPPDKVSTQAERAAGFHANAKLASYVPTPGVVLGLAIDFIAIATEPDRDAPVDLSSVDPTTLAPPVGPPGGRWPSLTRRASQKWPKHHPFPKYLGGAPAQTLKKIPRKLHEQFHTALDRWMGGKYSRRKGAEHFKNMDRETVIKDVRQFYSEAEGGLFKKYLPDFEQAVRESR